MTAWWVLYNTIHRHHSIEVRTMFANNYREISEIFSEMYEGNTKKPSSKRKYKRFSKEYSMKMIKIMNL